MIKTLFGFIISGKKTLKSNYNWQGEIDKIANLGSEINKNSNSGLVSQDTTQEEFKKRFIHLSISRFLCFLAMIFSISKSIGDQPIFGFLSATLAAVIFAIMFFQYTYKSWICVKIWQSWSTRFNIKKPRFGRFISEILTNPHIFVVYKL
jgi:hypothetical protein